MNSSRRHWPRTGGFTLIELMVVLAISAVLLTLTAGKFRELIRIQRLKAVTSQLVTDLNFARSEASSRSAPVYFTWRNVPGLGFTCYSIYLSTGLECECASGPGAACVSAATQTEVRTVHLLIKDAVRLSSYSPPAPDLPFFSFGYDNLTGGVVFGTSDFVPATPKAFGVETTLSGETTVFRLRVLVGQGGQVTVCSAGSKQISGYPAC